MLDVSFVKPALPRAGALVVPVAEEGGLGGLAADLDAAAGGALRRALAAADFKGRKGQSATVWAPLPDGQPGPSRIVAVGLGKAAELSAEAAEAAGSAALPSVRSEREATVAADWMAPDLAASFALGMALRGYRFGRYRTDEKEDEKPKLEGVAVATGSVPDAKAAWAPMRAVADGVFLARDLVSEPPNVLNPEAMADRCRELEKLGVQVEILGPKEIRKLGMGAVLGVAQGSANEPRVAVMQWLGASGGGNGKKGKDARKPIAFIGKGVTFDTGGISIKAAGGMEDMKFDMAGGAAVIGLMAALAGRRAKVDAVGLVGMVENMPSGTAQRPGDVVKTMSGKTVEVINTDAEGRLVLADVMTYCQERFAPAAMVDVATLTGAIIVALGHEHAGLFSNDDELAARIMAAGKGTGEACWRMPLGDAYDKQIRSDIADMKNVGGRPGGSITAAQFIQRFVGGGGAKNGKNGNGAAKDGEARPHLPWAHIDIAGTAWTTKDLPSVPKGATGFGVRLLDRVVAAHYEG